jgi:hypothetical protein
MQIPSQITRRLPRSFLVLIYILTLVKEKDNDVGEHIPFFSTLCSPAKSTLLLCDQGEDDSFPVDHV